MDNPKKFFLRDYAIKRVQEHPGEEFVVIMLFREKLSKYDRIVGSLEAFDYEGQKVIFSYQPEDFSDEYRSEFPEYFLNEAAPEELKNLFYRPFTVNMVNEAGFTRLVYHPLELTPDIYEKFYEWLNGKDLSKFKTTDINKQIIASIDLRNKSRAGRSR